MEYRLSLPDLQRRLDALHGSQSITLANRQIETLFGFNDVGTARLKRFARGHHCIIAHSDDCVVFHKMPPRH